MPEEDSRKQKKLLQQSMLEERQYQKPIQEAIRMTFYNAAKNFPQDPEKLAEDTEFRKEELEECPECGESIEDGGCIISPLKTSCATFNCGSCGSVVDKWAEKVIS